MEENKLKLIDGKKIRRQYFNVLLIALYSVTLIVLYFFFVISSGMGRLDPSEWPSTIWLSIGLGFCFSLPLLLLRMLNRHFFGRIICVLTLEGLYYPKGMLRWETIEKIEYAMDAKPRYKSDPAKPFRAIVYTKGGKHVVLLGAPMYLLSRVKKHRDTLDVQISGASSVLSFVLILAAVLLLCPLYVLLLINAPGISGSQLILLAVIFLIVGVIRSYVFKAYAVKYRFWRRILPRKWLSYLVLGCYYSSFFAALLVLFYFPNWVVTALVGIYLGIVQPPIPSKRVSRSRTILSYEALCDIYIRNAGRFEKRTKTKKDKNSTKFEENEA